MEQLIILDYVTGTVDIYPVVMPDSDEDYVEVEPILKKLGHRPSDCDWMFITGDITFHKEPVSP